MGAFAVPLMVASTAVSAYGAYKQGQSQAAASRAQGQAVQYQAEVDAQAQEYNARVAENNAIIADNNARAVLNQASEKEQAQLRNMAFMRGQARAAAAQSGAGVDGSNADIMRQNDILAELDALNIRYTGQQEASGLMATAGNLRAQAGLNRFMADRSREGARYNMRVANMNADNAMTAGYLNAGANILSGASNYSLYKGGYFNRTGSPSTFG